MDRPAKRQRIIKEEEDPTSLFLPPLSPAISNIPIQAPVAGGEAVTLSQEQLTAIEAIVKGDNVFLTGSAGSGKTMVLHKSITGLRDLGKRVKVVAPTGKAACGANGTTIHSLFGLTPKKMQRSMRQLESMVEQDELLRLRLADIDTLVIDEISMVENIFFSRLNRLMQAAQDEEDIPFGGVQIVVCGDFCQLAPVKPFSYCFRCGGTTEESRSRERKVKVWRCFKCDGEADEPDQWAFCSDAWEYCQFVNLI